MAGRSRKYTGRTLLDIPGVHGSPESAAGKPPSDSPDGPTTGPSGPRRALAPHSPPQGKRSGVPSAEVSPSLIRSRLESLLASPAGTSGTPTVGTSGRKCSVSSASAVLSRFLGSRLRAKTDCNGSMEYQLRWKLKVTPSGRRITQLRASARPTSDSGCSGLLSSPVPNPPGWATPTVRDHKDGASTLDNTPINGLLGRQVSLVGWETPTTVVKARSEEFRKGRELNPREALSGWLTPKTPTGGAKEERTTEGGGTRKLEDQVLLAGWPTARKEDGDGGMRTAEGAEKEFARKGQGADLPTIAHLAEWPTAEASNGNGGQTSSDPLSRVRPSGTKKALSLNEAAQLTGWPTPAVVDSTSNVETPEARMEREGRGGMNLSTAATMTSGGTIPSSPAETGSSAALNASFSAWLQGYPREWCEAAIRAHRSMRTTRRKQDRCVLEDMVTRSASKSPQSSLERSSKPKRK